MGELINIYCDESCHLEHDRQSIMLLGAVWCPESKVRKNTFSILRLKEEYNARGELKWTKVSPSRESFYIEIVNWFFQTQNLNFRCIVVQNKERLNHSYYNQGDHDSFYYKMYYYLLRNVITAEDQYKIYLDIKDTRSQTKVNKLREVLCNSLHDFAGDIITRIQSVRSKEVELIQLSDFLMGAVSYINRNLSTNKSKNAVVARIQRQTRLSLKSSTPPWEEKFNLFFFTPRSIENE